MRRSKSDRRELEKAMPKERARMLDDVVEEKLESKRLLAKLISLQVF